MEFITTDYSRSDEKWHKLTFEHPAPPEGFWFDSFGCLAGPGGIVSAEFDENRTGYDPSIDAAIRWLRDFATAKHIAENRFWLEQAALQRPPTDPWEDAFL